MNFLGGTIAAISTPPGKGGVAIIRVSGEGAFEIAKKIFRPVDNKEFSDIKPRYAKYGYIVRDGETLDDVLLTKFPSPNSFTGEDTVEIACHGGILLTQTVLELLFTEGARAAEAGEFTRRAFINGKLSLTDAEAIGTLLEAKSEAQIKLSSDTSRTRLSQRLSAIRDSLVNVLSSVFARIDYPDEDLGDFSDGELLKLLYNVNENILSLTNTYKTGKAVSEGIKTAIVGKPNVGKSTIYNLLLGEDAAIVTDIPGTTRDLLKSSATLGDVMLNIADTAGVRGEAADAVEAIGIKKTEKILSECELLFAVFDISRPFDKEDQELIRLLEQAGGAKIAILNKSDSAAKFGKEKLPNIFDDIITASAKKNDDELITLLRDSVERLFLDGEIKLGEDAVISTARQSAALIRSGEMLNRAISALEAGFAQDAVAGDLERALGAVSEIDGRAVSEEVVSDIFARFCVGK